MYVAAIILHGVGEFDGAVNVENGFEISTGILVIVIPCRTGAAVDVVTGLVKHLGEVVISCGAGERNVGEFHQNHKEVLLSHGYVAAGPALGVPLPPVGLRGIAPGCEGAIIHGPVESVFIQFDYLPGGVGGPVMELVAVFLYHYYGAVGLDVSELAGPCWNGIRRCADEQDGDESC